jgi:hypothetical protein
MSERRSCDICGRSEDRLSARNANDSLDLELDEDGLWICRDCRARLVTSPVGQTVAADLSDEIRALVGESAGAICFTLNLPYEPPYRTIIDAASKVWEMHMSSWSFVTQLSDGTTVFRAPDGDAIATVTRDGCVQIERK